MGSRVYGSVAPSLILQDINVPEWQKNQMITFEVDNLDAYWAELKALDLEGVRRRKTKGTHRIPVGPRDPRYRSCRSLLAHSAMRGKPL